MNEWVVEWRDVWVGSWIAGGMDGWCMDGWVSGEKGRWIGA